MERCRDSNTGQQQNVPFYDVRHYSGPVSVGESTEEVVNELIRRTFYNVLTVIQQFTIYNNVA
jgi:hypothetical protein